MQFDKLGVPLKVNDEVIWNLESNSNAFIVRFTPKMVRIKYRYSPKGHWKDRTIYAKNIISLEVHKEERPELFL